MGRGVAGPATASWRAIDVQLAAYAALLAAIGVAMAYSNSLEAGRPVLEAGSILVRGLAWIALAVTAFVVAAGVDHRWFTTLAWPLYFAQLGLLGLTLVVGDGPGGAARWIAFGPVALQLSELAKVLTIAALASYLSAPNRRPESPTTILGACALAAPPAVLVMLQPDLGTSLVFVAILVGMLFLSGASLRWLGALAAAAVAIVPLALTHLLKDYQKARLMSFLDPAADPQGAGYQLYQAQVAVGSGGWMGKGLTNGTQGQLDYLPVQTTDFVYALLAEELGFVGGAIVLLLFTVLLWRVLAVGWRSRDPFGAAFCAGVASMLLFQLIVNVGMVVGVMPITGIPLPFVTHGGASLVSTAVALGIVEGISRRRMRVGW